jgi:hypothetical protein
VPAPVAALAGVAEIDVAPDAACARLRSGAVLCWGADANGHLGAGTSSFRAAPVAVAGLP